MRRERVRHVILAVTGLLGFITIVFCVFNDVAFYTILLRAGVVMIISILVGLIGISMIVLFGYLGADEGQGSKKAGAKTKT